MSRRTVADLRESAERVLEHVTLAEVYLASARLGVTQHDEVPAPPYSVDTDIQVKAERRPGRVEAWARYVTTATTGSVDGVTASDPRLAVWTVDLECVAVFGDDDEGASDRVFDQADLEAFAVVMGAPTLHPFAREATQSLSARTQYPGYTIGLLTPVLAYPDDHEVTFPQNDREPGPEDEPSR